jgi:N-acetylglucosamine kinase-like BadF-type ATPase
LITQLPNYSITQLPDFLMYSASLMTVLGIDAGGTKTVCHLVDEQARTIVETRGPGANLQASGELEVEKALHQVIAQALAESGASPAAICLGMAGVDRPRDADVVRGILLRIGQRAQPFVVNDALIALEAGVPGGAGVVVVAGTGSIAYGRDARGRAARAGGWGYVLGDEGSGYWLGRQALRAVVRAADGRGRATALTPRVLAHYQVDRAQDLVWEVYRGGMKPTAIAALAAEVGAAAAEGDGLAMQIIDAAGAELAGAAVSVARRLSLDRCPVILAGGVLRGVAPLRARLVADLGKVLPNAEVRVLHVEPAEGAARLALALAAGQPAIPAYVDAV